MKHPELLKIPIRRLLGSGRLPFAVAVVGLLALGLLSGSPDAWARPDQAPDYQTVPTLTPTPSPPGQGPTPTPRPPTSTPVQPTDTPRPSQPTNTPLATATSTAVAPSPTNTPSPVGATATQGPMLPSQCWSVPTPGFVPVVLDDITLEARSEQRLVVPGQSLTLTLLVTNGTDTALSGLLICNPLDPALERGEPTVASGQATTQLVAEGLVVQAVTLAPGRTVRVTLDLRVPSDHPLGGVIENQAWLFVEGQRASSDLLTWALPPAWLPPTGD